MAIYVRPGTAVQNAMYTAAQWDQDIVENFAAGVPGIIGQKGDLAYATRADAAARLAVPSSTYEINRRGLVINEAGDPEWDKLIFSRWAILAITDISPRQATPLPITPIESVNCTPTSESNSYYITIPESGVYQAAMSLFVVVGIGSVVANQVVQAYVSVNGTDYQVARYTADVTTGQFSYQCVRGIYTLPGLVAGDVIRFKMRNEMTIRLTTACFGTIRKLR